MALGAEGGWEPLFLCAYSRVCCLRPVFIDLDWEGIQVPLPTVFRQQEQAFFPLNISWVVLFLRRPL